MYKWQDRKQWDIKLLWKTESQIEGEIKSSTGLRRKTTQEQAPGKLLEVLT